MFFDLWRGKRTPQDRGATTFIPPEYDVCGDITPHMPSTGEFGMMHMTSHPGQQLLVGNHLDLRLFFRPMMAIPWAVGGCDRGPVDLDYQCTSISGA